MQQLLTGKKRLPEFGEGKGDQQTEVGVIPKDWNVVTIREITSLVTNGFVGKATNHYTDKDDGITYIQGYNVEANSFNFNGIKNNTPDSFLNGSVRLSELVVQGSSHFIKVSSAPNLEKKILLTAG